MSWESRVRQEPHPGSNSAGQVGCPGKRGVSQDPPQGRWLCFGVGGSSYSHHSSYLLNSEKLCVQHGEESPGLLQGGSGGQAPYSP